jgi:dolichol kinase
MCNTKPEFSLKGELSRKLIHLFSSSIPVGYIFLNKEFVLPVLIILLCAMSIFELIKYKSDFIYNLYCRIFGYMLRNHEYDRLKFRINGATWLLLADILCIIIFPKFIAVTGMLVLSLADSLSAVFGKLYGKKMIKTDRSYLGSLVFFIVTLVIISVTPKYQYTFTEYSIYFLMALITTSVDIIKLPVDDNFYIPLVSCTSLFILYKIFIPQIQFTLL